MCHYLLDHFWWICRKGLIFVTGDLAHSYLKLRVESHDGLRILINPLYVKEIHS